MDRAPIAAIAGIVGWTWQRLRARQPFNLIDQDLAVGVDEAKEWQRCERPKVGSERAQVRYVRVMPKHDDVVDPLGAEKFSFPSRTLIEAVGSF